MLDERTIIAVAAMQALLPRHSAMADMELDRATSFFGEIAADAYDIADAMLAERDSRGEVE